MIIAFASTANGVTKDQVVEHLGRPSSSTLEKLVEAGIVVADHGRYRCVQDSIFPCDNASIKAQIAHGLMLIRDEHIGKKRQHCNIEQWRHAERKSPPSGLSPPISRSNGP